MIWVERLRLMNNYEFDPRTNRQIDDSEEMLIAEALYIYERNLEGDNNPEYEED